MDSSQGSGAGATARTGNYADGPPWIFTGRALYQLHLVKADVARRFIPPELKVVQAFGYTLGGLYLAHYDSSPVGVFDELVVVAGIVWNPPTSCAWAARVLVNNEEARDHGRKEVGLPSHTADFSLRACAAEKQQQQRWWDILPKKVFGKGLRKKPTGGTVTVDIVETKASLRRPLCHITLLNNMVMGSEGQRWPGLSIRMSLPSFSGKTKQQPELLKYACELKCRVRPLQAALISLPEMTHQDKWETSGDQDLNPMLSAVLTGKPIAALVFERMVMHVDAPQVVIPNSSHHKLGVFQGQVGHHVGSSVPATPVEAS